MALTRSETTQLGNCITNIKKIAEELGEGAPPTYDRQIELSRQLQEVNTALTTIHVMKGNYS